MKRRTLDLMFSLGGVAIAILLTVAGVVLTSNANFATDYVTSQLAEQNITFKTLDTLTPEEREQPGLVEYAGQKLTTGKQAEVYALQFIGLHLKNTAGGKTYADLGVPQSQLRAQVAEAAKNNEPNLAALQQQLADVTAQRETMFKGETLRGLLLTTYGFSEFGTKAGQAALVAYLAALVMTLLSIVGFVHAFRTPRTEAFAPVEAAPVREKINA
ncbi:hypothetical protein [Catellatospora methionotrophica]|uniref:hypothetical protein n=1 Tax=Catellatospora methionotrophica TaxID=121620 RepID=UPI0033E01A71